MVFKGIVGDYCEKYMKHINTLCGQYLEVSMLMQVVHIATTVLQRAKVNYKPPSAQK
jgi:hypothetical protein